MAFPTREQILKFYDHTTHAVVSGQDKTPVGYKPRSEGRRRYCEWFLDFVGEESSYTTKAGNVKEGHTPLRIRALYLLEKALNARARAEKKTAKAASGS